MPYISWSWPSWSPSPPPVTSAEVDLVEALVVDLAEENSVDSAAEDSEVDLEVDTEASVEVSEDSEADTEGSEEDVDLEDMDGKPRLHTTTLTTENSILYFNNKVS
ncbi:uncharacterized protein [Penaeus vannamei]|uniref:uncharacterized protein n=1 Tax=Penaeus vannamei TaxID=6689 RepID=UPI00387F6438